jgi:UDP-glucose 4-epimerase
METQFKKVLVTGGAGCIGMQMCSELIQRGIDVCLFDLPEQIHSVKKNHLKKATIYYGSILDRSSLRDAMSGCDAVIHLAAYLGVRRTETNRLRCIEINIEGTKNVLECSVQQRIKKIIFASSSEVYGEPLENPVSENSPTQGKTVYAISKLAGEELCKAYSQRYPELDFTILRYFNTYGPYQIAQFVIPKFLRNVMEGKEPVIYGDGKQIRSFCYASDNARATVDALIRNEVNGETINIGNSSNPISLIELAELVIDVCGKKGLIKPKLEKKFSNTDRTKEREIFERFCDTSKAERMLEFKPKVTIRKGLENVVSHGIIQPKWATTDYAYTLDEWL